MAAVAANLECTDPARAQSPDSKVATVAFEIAAPIDGR